MNRLATVARIWIGFGIAVAVAVVLGALGAVAAANQSPGWAAGAVALGAILVALAGTWVAMSVGGSLHAVAGQAERIGEAVAAGKLDVRFDLEPLSEDLRAPFEHTNGALERLARSVRTAGERLSALSRGEIPAPDPGKEGGELGRARQALDGVAGEVGALVDDLQSLSAAARGDKSGVRIAEDRHAGRFQAALRAQQDALEQLARRAQWLERILDALPMPLTATDREGRTTFLNAAAEQLLDTPRASALGRPAERDRLAAAAGRRGRVLALQVAELKGDAAGRVEIAQDQTALSRMAEYSIAGMSKLARALEQLAAGDLAVDVALPEGDEHTEDRRKQLLLFAQAIGRVREAIAALVRDSTRLADATVAGRLADRIDPRAHPGEFRKVAEGLNQALDHAMAPVNEATRVLDELGQRNLRARITSEYGGDHARIKESVNTAAGALHDAMAQVSDAVEQVSSAASQIAASSQAVASGASQQAASLEQTSSSIESVASMTRQSADNAQQANRLAETARGAAGQGTAAVEQMQTAMARIKASAEGTSQIIRDINDIAFQTNLLALNAAVEAARAGEAGRGFAVVAEEVRSLALRAKEAAMKTEELIRQSVKEAGDGEVTAKEVAGKLADIAGGISKVTDIISEIAAGAREQANGIDQVNRAVAEMDRVIQQNAASAEESSSAASELSGQAEELASMIGAFRLERRARRGAASARLPAAPPRAGAGAAEASPAPAPAGAPSPARPSARDPDRIFPMEEAGELKDF